MVPSDLAPNGHVPARDAGSPQGVSRPPATKAFQRGTHRLVEPTETLRRARAIFGPVGITRVANVTGLDCIGIPVVMACRPNARSLAVSQGKGIDLDAARASAVMEAIELHHAERMTHSLKLATYNELRFSHDIVAVDALPRTSVSVYSADRGLLWTAGLELFSARPMWLPYELVHTNYTMPLPSGSGCFVMSSNGLASGNHPLEALVHGLCEVVERDAATLFRLKSVVRQEERRLDLDAIADDDIRRLLQLYATAGVAVGAWDITSDVGVPAFRTVIVDREPSPFRPLGPVEGMGCHLSPVVALARALTEAAQGRLTLIAGSRDDNGRARYAGSQDGALVERARARLALRGTRRLELASSVGLTFEDDVAAILAGLRRAGISQVIAVDLTKPEFAIPVVRVVVPGLETYHHVQGYVPGERARRVLDAAERTLP